MQDSVNLSVQYLQNISLSILAVGLQHHYKRWRRSPRCPDLYTRTDAQDSIFQWNDVCKFIGKNIPNLRFIAVWIMTSQGDLCHIIESTQKQRWITHLKEISVSNRFEIWLGPERKSSKFGRHWNKNQGKWVRNNAQRNMETLLMHWSLTLGLLAYDEDELGLDVLFTDHQ